MHPQKYAPPAGGRHPRKYAPHKYAPPARKVCITPLLEVCTLPQQCGPPTSKPAGGMHPTGMHPCYCYIKFKTLVIQLQWLVHTAMATAICVLKILSTFSFYPFLPNLCSTKYVPPPEVCTPCQKYAYPIGSMHPCRKYAPPARSMHPPQELQTCVVPPIGNGNWTKIIQPMLLSLQSHQY